MEFNAKETKENLIKWTRDYFDRVGGNKNAIIGISGGKDSSTCAALLVEALGSERVYGVLMPNGIQHDIDYSLELVSVLGIHYFKINVADTVSSFYKEMDNAGLVPNYIVKSNMPARIRMTTLYNISAILNGLVCNTCNLSEDYVGYATKFGDAAGDFSLLSQLTVTEVKAIARELGLPEKFIEKVPEDGLSGKTDEDNLGFTYDVLDKYIRTNEIDDPTVKEKIDNLNKVNQHKLLPMPCFNYIAKK